VNLRLPLRACAAAAAPNRAALPLQVYKGDSHPHEAQQPTNITAHISQKPSKGPGAALLASKAK
jgi:hypothetical protein